MSNYITYFMWGYQQHFRISMQTKADRLFGELDDHLQPEVFLAGVLAETHNASRFPTCVEPEDDFWIHSSDLGSVREIAPRLVNQYPESVMSQSLPLAQERQDQDLALRSIRDAITEVIDTHPQRPENRRFYVSYPAQVAEYWVCLVLSLRDDIVASYPELLTSSVELHAHRSYHVPVSLLNAVADQFLRYAREELRKPEPAMPEFVDDEDLLRSAGADMARGVVWRMSGQLVGYGGSLFRDCSTISSLYYERSTGSGRILLAADDHPGVDPVVSFDVPVGVRDYRAARKLLQLSFGDVMLHSDSNQLFGLAKDGGADIPKEDLFEVRILGHHQWELRHHDRVLMTVRYGVPSLPRPRIDRVAFRERLAAAFEGISNSATDLLLSLVEEAERESHGTMLLISTAAAEEAKRLAPQGMPITPCTLTPELLKHLTPIDGAVVLDPEGMCHAIGVILDGNATEKGDPSRGARFNSAVRYVESSAARAPCLAVVVSEDGGVDFIP